MIKNWLSWINYALASVIIFFMVVTVIFHLARPSVISVEEPSLEKSTLPKGAFAMKQEAYNAIGPPLLTLRFSPLSLQLPDLRNYLQYYGRNERPDANIDQSLLHFAFAGAKDTASVPAKAPLYLVYDQDPFRMKYRFSPNNAETSFWIEATPQDKEVVVFAAMKNERGEIIRKPELYAQFKLREKELARFGGIEKWEVGKWKVDGTLLARQKAKWYGVDLFLERHGGEAFAAYRGKQRIDFTEGAEPYSVYVNLWTPLAWVGEKWEVITLGEESKKLPLLVVSNIDERLMKLELWDVEGKAKIALHLIKSAEPMAAQNIEQTFKFVGARTKSHLMFEINNERVMLSPQDWLLYSQGKWKKIATAEEIDSYVNRKTLGPLFIIDDITKEEGRQVLTGTLFNDARTEMKTIEIPLLQGNPATPPVKSKFKKIPSMEERRSNERLNQPPEEIDEETDEEAMEDSPDLKKLRKKHKNLKSRKNAQTVELKKGAPRRGK